MSSKEEKKEITASVLEYLAHVPDPRVERTRAHPLVNILVMALLAVLCGADSFAAIEEFGKCKQELLTKFLDLTNGIPSHDKAAREDTTRASLVHSPHPDETDTEQSPPRLEDTRWLGLRPPALTGNRLAACV